MRLKNNNQNKRKIGKKSSKKGILSVIFISIILYSIISHLNTTLNIELLSESTEDFSETYTNPSIQGDTIFKFSFGTNLGPTNIDPHKAWEANSIKVIDQVCEGLYKYNLSSQDLAVIPNLATDFGNWSTDKLNYTIPLRSSVVFHDGGIFNASTVKWSFDRLAYFMNITGNLPIGIGLTVLKSLYEWNDGMPIINRTEIISEYVIRFVLNRPYIPFSGLLCFSGSYILSPYSTPKYDYIDTINEDLVGTGPFEYDSYIPGVEVKFHAFNNYWQGKAKIELLTFSIIPNTYDRMAALLSGDVDLLNDPNPIIMDSFAPSPDITLIDDGPSTTLYYIGMNNKLINKTMRQAISYAINYSHIIDVIMNNQSVRLKSPIPEGILFANWSLNVATLNVTKARQTLVDNGVCNFDINDDIVWTDAAINNPLAIYDFSYTSGSSTSGEIGLLLETNLRAIGIGINLVGLSYSEWLNRLTNVSDGHNKLELFYAGWGPDFNDPSNFINILFSNRSTGNAAQVNNPWLQQKMDTAVTEINATIRGRLYDEIQQYIVEDLMPWVFCSVPRNFDAYHDYIIGYPSNPMEKVWLYDISLNSTLFSGKIHIDGNQEWAHFKNAGKCTGEGTYSDPYIIDGLEIDAEGSGSCILIKNSEVYFNIENCTLQNSGADWNDAGIHLIQVENGYLINNLIYNASNGIFLENSDINFIAGNNITNVLQDAIHLWYSNNNLIIENNILNSNWGIILYYSQFANISGNEVNNNVYQGISLWDSNYNFIVENSVYNNGDSGILLFNSDNNYVLGNIVSLNYHGIHLGHSDDNEIVWNTLNNNDVGIYLYISYNNNVSDNIFSGNSKDIEEFGQYYNPYLPGIVSIVVASIVIALIAIGVIIIKKKSTRGIEVPFKKEEIVRTGVTRFKAKEIQPKISISDNIKVCHYCGKELRLEARFCVECGKKYEEIQQTPIISDVMKEEFKKSPNFCRFCGIELIKEARFCSQCGRLIN
jgi:parallel beta-helix repeat protein